MSTTRAQNTVKIYGFHLGETEKAVRFSVHKVGDTPLDIHKTEWFPFSQTHSITRAAAPGEQDCIVVNEWIAQQKELV